MTTPTLGQLVWYYRDRAHARGMKSVDDHEPFMAFVASVATDRLANLLVIDHLGTTFACQSVPVFQDDDKDDKKAPAHCELKAPKPKEAKVPPGAFQSVPPPQASPPPPPKAHG